MEIVRFSTNWNNKLNCTAFSTIRIKSNKYAIGNTYMIQYLDHGERKQFPAKILTITHFYLATLSQGMALLDTGYNREETIKIIERIHKNSNIDLKTTLFSHIIFKRV